MIRNNLHFAVLREGKGKAANVGAFHRLKLSQHITSYPVSQGTLINIAAVVCDDQKAGTPFEGHWVSDVSREEVNEKFQNFEPAARNILKVSLGLGRSCHS